MDTFYKKCERGNRIWNQKKKNNKLNVIIYILDEN